MIFQGPYRALGGGLGMRDTGAVLRTGCASYLSIACRNQNDRLLQLQMDSAGTFYKNVAPRRVNARSDCEPLPLPSGRFTVNDNTDLQIFKIFWRKIWRH